LQLEAELQSFSFFIQFDLNNNPLEADNENE